MFEELIVQLDELGVAYTEDYDTGMLTVDIADVDKAVLIDIISALTSGGYTFDITETTITVEGGAAPVDEEFDEDAYLDEALTQM